MLSRLAKDESEKYATFWKELSQVLKEGIAEDSGNRERIAKLLRFSSTHTDLEKQDQSLDDYIARLKPELVIFAQIGAHQQTDWDAMAARVRELGAKEYAMPASQAAASPPIRVTASLAEARPLPTGEIGEIIVRGPVVTREYDGLPDATAAAKIADGGEVWHRMGDCGFIDAAGRLWFCGRKAERVETAAGPLTGYDVDTLVLGSTASGTAMALGAGGTVPASTLASTPAPRVQVTGSSDTKIELTVRGATPGRPHFSSDRDSMSHA